LLKSCSSRASSNSASEINFFRSKDAERYNSHPRCKQTGHYGIFPSERTTAKIYFPGKPGGIYPPEIEYLMEKVISPERESAKQGSSPHSELEQSLERQNSVSTLPKLVKKSLHERETLIVDNFFNA